ncbi:NitT/TauT family transport system permease protein [Actinoplanes lutulentus]|uniref:NitT/TauT family transport system permease protein n=1 Tax=Actinoplanes lutulentus TaxID=1287878 RepID=A0A327Z843_9ACTN|nr:ABC transporter permease [Actinoplanes lutulentus]MBB2946258.1 NitT/TauT family transport system permease protein [Actinoplanes lutulentus]RAK32945.1 NitT/TauT family transport system permease protein [Actinoplanes lutulentus]
MVAVALPVLFLLTLIGAWYLLVRLYDVPPQVVPSPETVGSELVRLPEYLATQSWYTLREVWAGFAIAVVIGVALALAISASRVVDQAVSPILVGFNAIPKIAIGPMLVMWFGFGMQPKIFVVVLLCFFPIVLSTVAGLRSTPADLIELTRSLDASRVKTFLKVRVPWALPQFFTGLKLAISLAFVGAVVGEFIGGGRDGIGYVIVAAKANIQTGLAFAGIFLLALMSIASYYALVALERLLLPWSRETTS